MNSIIDLTADSDDEEANAKNEGQPFLANLSKPSQYLPNTLKRKWPHDSVGNGDGVPKVTTNNGAFNPSQTLAGDQPCSINNEKRSTRPAIELVLPVTGRPTSSSSKRSTSSISFRKDERWSSQSADRPAAALQQSRKSRTSSSRESSYQPPLRKGASRSTSTPDDDMSLPTRPAASHRASRFPTISVVVPPPSSRATVTIGMKAESPRKIERVVPVSPSASSDEKYHGKPPTGLDTKYYPLDLDQDRIARGRYPQVRTTNAQHVAKIPNQKPDRVRSAQSKLFHLRGILDRKLRAIKGPPVTVAGDWNGTGSLASNFEFVNAYKLQKGVERVPAEFNSGCSCGPQCDPARCTCLSQEEDTEDRMVAYERRGRKLVMKASFLHKKTMVFECNSYCGCGKECWNRLVQHGRTVRLEIFQTGNRGFGLRSPDPIVRGQFIDRYLGEVITSAEADLREDAASLHNSPSYLFSLDFIHMDDDDDEPYVVDGQRLGGPSRFMNHSCNPNCKLFTVSTHHGDSRIYDLAVFALRDIPPGTELTFDYNPDWNGDRNHDPNAVKCLCGESKCRGQLWPNQRKSTKDD